MPDSLEEAVASDAAEAQRLLRQYKRVAAAAAHLGVMAGEDFARGCVAMAAAVLLDGALAGDVSAARPLALQYIAGVGTGQVEAATVHEARDRMLRLSDEGSVLRSLGAEIASAVEAVEVLDLQDLAP